jgi:hypothetical protein
MSLEVFSTQTTLENRKDALGLLTWTDDDDDDTPDSATLAQAFQEASGKIFEYLLPRYGETELASWTISTAPDRILRISDDLCIRFVATRHHSQNELIQTIYDEAIESLRAIRDHESGLYGASYTLRTCTTEKLVSDSTDNASSDEESENPFKDRTYFNNE